MASGILVVEAQSVCMHEDIVSLYRNIKIAPGVSASHLDWTMIPYVRMSFKKHYLDGLKYIEEASAVQINHYANKEDLSIESSFYKSNPRAYKYAMDLTEREIHQAVEGLYHNLNSLQSRSGNQLDSWLVV